MTKIDTAKELVERLASQGMEISEEKAQEAIDMTHKAFGVEKLTAPEVEYQARQDVIESIAVLLFFLALIALFIKKCVL